MPSDKTQLKLTLKKEWFDLMVTGEKQEEYRAASAWIESRLKNNHYRTVRFTNGYGAHRPYFVAQYLGYKLIDSSKIILKEYSNGSIVSMHGPAYVIKLGNIIEKGNTYFPPLSSIPKIAI